MAAVYLTSPFTCHSVGVSPAVSAHTLSTQMTGPLVRDQITRTLRLTEAGRRVSQFSVEYHTVVSNHTAWLPSTRHRFQ